MTSHVKFLTYMLGRMQHLVYLTYRDIALENGFLTAVPCDPPGWSKFRIGPAAAQLLNGETAHDATILTNVIHRHFKTIFRSKDLMDDDGMSDSGTLMFQFPTSLTGEKLADSANILVADQSNTDYVLSLLRTIPRNLRADEVAVVAMLAMSLDDSDVTVAQLSKILRKPAWLAGISGKAKGFSGTLARLLESGALLPRQYRLRDGNGGYSISGRVHRESANVSRRTVISFALTELHDLGPERTRRLVEKTLRRRVPVLIADEEVGSWPPRLVAGLDLVLDLPRLDISLLADIIERCTNLPSAELKAAILKRNLACECLGLDDLVLAIAPTRSVFDIIDRLVALTDEFQVDEAKKEKRSEEETPKRAVRPGKDAKGNREAKSRSVKGAELIMPEPDFAGDTSMSDQPHRLTVEALSGYGRAREWALHLKEDLALWREGQLPWSDMSTKLLLSGPPGTGKTTFARALCNSLQLPLYVSSVTRWLEPGYLGDVLKRITDAFSTAKESAPSILLLDELDGIGKRGDGSRSYDDYWTQVVNRALELLDGAIQSEGVIIIGATNFPARIDSALLRSGRLETHIAIPKPDTEALVDILRYHLASDLDDVVSSLDSVEQPVEQKHNHEEKSNV